MCWYPHAIKLLQKCVIFNEAINLHSRGPTEQHFYVWEPHCGCLHKVKKVQFYTPLVGGQRSHKYAFQRVNAAINLEIVLVPPCSILLGFFLISLLAWHSFLISLFPWSVVIFLSLSVAFPFQYLIAISVYNLYSLMSGCFQLCIFSFPGTCSCINCTVVFPKKLSWALFRIYCNH